MANLLNIDAESGADFIGDDAEPSLAFSNSSTGAGLESDSFVATSGATIARIDTAPGIAVAAATITQAEFQGASVASGAVLSFKGDSLVSLTTIKFITGGVNGTKALRIAMEDGSFSWIPVLPDSAVTGAVI